MRSGRFWQTEAFGMYFLPAVVAVLMTLTISIAEEDDAIRTADLFSYTCGFAIAGLLVFRRRWPIEVLLVSIGILMVYYSLNYPAFSPALPLAAATYFAALAGRAVFAAVADGTFLLIGAAWQTLGEGSSAFKVIGDHFLADAALLAAFILLGEVVRHRRAWAMEVEERERQADLRRRRETEAELERSRLHTARELHDVLAHTIAGINVQAAVAADFLDQDPERSREALSGIRRQSRQATADLRASIELLRGESDAGETVPAPGLGELDGLIESARIAGVEVSVRGSAPSSLPTVIDLTAYRIVQESLTNLLRHSRAAAATVRIELNGGQLILVVEDGGPSGSREVQGGAGPGGRTGTGHGLTGMKERVTALDGEFSAGPRPDGGFVVEAVLPLREDEA